MPKMRFWAKSTKTENSEHIQTNAREIIANMNSVSVLWLGGTRRATLVLLGMNVGIRTGEKAPNLEDVRQREAASG